MGPGFPLRGPGMTFEVKFGTNCSRRAFVRSIGRSTILVMVRLTDLDEEIARATLVEQLNQSFGTITPEMMEVVGGVKSILFGDETLEYAVSAPPPERTFKLSKPSVWTKRAPKKKAAGSNRLCRSRSASIRAIGVVLLSRPKKPTDPVLRVSS